MRDSLAGLTVGPGPLAPPGRLLSLLAWEISRAAPVRYLGGSQSLGALAGCSPPLKLWWNSEVAVCGPAAAVSAVDGEGPIACCTLFGVLIYCPVGRADRFVQRAGTALWAQIASSARRIFMITTA